MHPWPSPRAGVAKARGGESPGLHNPGIHPGAEGWGYPLPARGAAPLSPKKWVIIALPLNCIIMPRLQIWNAGQIALHEHPPVFSASERNYFLKLPEGLQAHLDASRNLTHKIGFQLSFAYFLARKRFYLPDHFHMEDIRYLCHRLGIPALVFDAQQYKGRTYSRHKKIILEHFAFQPFELSKHNPLISEAISEQISRLRLAR